MKKIQLLSLAILISGATLLQSCFGGFHLTKNLYNWNDSVSNDKFVKTLVFWGMSIIPVYQIGVFGDVIIFNLIEFWSGSNPLGMNEGETDVQNIVRNGNEYRIEATKNQFHIVQLSGEDKGTEVTYRFNPGEQLWSMQVNEEAERPIIALRYDEESQTEVYEVYNSKGEAYVMDAEAAQKLYQVSAFMKTEEAL